jgi:hypothetical protein
VGQEEVANPCSDIVDGRYDTLLRRCRLVKRGDKPGMDEDRRENTDMVPANQKRQTLSQAPEDGEK